MDREEGTVIASDSFSVLSSIRSGRSEFRVDIVNEIFIIMYRMQVKGIFTIHNSSGSLLIYVWKEMSR